MKHMDCARSPWQSSRGAVHHAAQGTSASSAGLRAGLAPCTSPHPLGTLLGPTHLQELNSGFGTGRAAVTRHFSRFTRCYPAVPLTAGLEDTRNIFSKQPLNILRTSRRKQRIDQVLGTTAGCVSAAPTPELLPHRLFCLLL